MPRWLWFMPLGALMVALGVWGFRLGWIAATITETDVIDAYTARYLEAQGPDARATDCSAQPGQDAAVWIIVSCVTRGAERIDYPVDRMGRLLHLSPPAVKPEAPQT